MEINNFCNDIYHDLTSDDFLVCAIGFEERSSYLLGKNINTRNQQNTLVVFFDDFGHEKWFVNLDKRITELGIRREYCSYGDSDSFVDYVLECIKKSSQDMHFYIDYSSMPRSWYCGLLFEVNRKLKDYENLTLHFLYTAGNYPEKFSACGIGSLSCFVGKMLPSLEPNKLYIIALGYDVERTQSIISKLEPDSLWACYAYTKLGSKTQVETVNKDILESVTSCVSLQLNDFEGMLQRLNEIIIEQTRYGQVVVIPDGPKPLILAMSMISLINAEKNKEIVCLHVSHNDHLLSENKIKVTASEMDNDIYCVKYSSSDINK